MAGLTTRVAGGVLVCLLVMAANAAPRSDWVDALMRRDFSAIERLLPEQLDVDARTGDGRTALMLAAGEGRVDLMRALLARGGAAVNTTNDRGGTPLMYAATGGDPESVALLLAEGAAIDARARNGWTALMLAAVRGHDALVTLLLAHKADPNVADIYGWTALMRAVNADRAASVRALLANKRVDINAADDTGKTALHHAAAMGALDIVRALLAHGARPATRDRDGRTPYDIAIDAKHPEVAKALRQAPAG